MIVLIVGFMINKHAYTNIYLSNSNLNDRNLCGCIILLSKYYILEIAYAQEFPFYI